MISKKWGSLSWVSVSRLQDYEVTWELRVNIVIQGLTDHNPAENFFFVWTTVLMIKWKKCFNHIHNRKQR